MPSIRYYNQTAPFWDFIANLENNAGNHPFFSAYNPESRQGGHQESSSSSAPPPPPHDGPSSPPNHDGPPPPPEGDHPPHNHPFGPSFPFSGHHRGGPRSFSRRCGTNPPWANFTNTPDFDLAKLADFFASHLTPTPSSSPKDTNPKDFSPPADIFDTDDAYIIHLSLPGAKKEDVGVAWDAEKSELAIAGVIYRPGGDEEFLKTLVMEERQVGVFERKIRLGSRASPAVVEEEGMGARMEDGVLIVRVPKRDAGYVEVRKVDIE
ncbi:MAG: hypothetical protein Q9182_002453 [Xanthomendoza sp. 2 TL-2023]